MKLVLLFGDAAVGKMTVGQALMEETGLRLFHNHMTIEPVLEIFGSFHTPTILELREVVFQNFAKTDLPGMIFTMMWDFDSKDDWDYVAHIAEIFQKQGAEVYYVELIAPQEVRLARNRTENRLRHKPSKRDLEQSQKRLLQDDKHHRCVSREGEIRFANYFRLENTFISPWEAAVKIKEYFSL